MNNENALKIADSSKAAFISKLVELGGHKLAFNAPLMPRSTWAACMISALIEAGALQTEAQVESAGVVLASELGNSSQLGATLLNDKVIVREKVQAATISFAAQLAAKAAAAAAK